MVSVAGIKEEEESLFTPLFTFLFDEGSEYLTCGIAAAPALKDAFLLVDADEILDCCTSCFVDRPAVDLILGLAVPLEFLLDFLFLVPRPPPQPPPPPRPPSRPPSRPPFPPPLPPDWLVESFATTILHELS